MRRGFGLGLSFSFILFFLIMPGMAFPEDSGASQEVTFQVFRTMTTDQGTWKQMCNHYTLTVLKDGTAVDLGTDGGVAEGTNGVLTIYLSPGDYSYQVNYNYPEYGQNPSQAGVTEGDFTISEGRLNFVEVDTSRAPAPPPKPKPGPTPTPSNTTTTMHPTKEEIDRWIMLYESDPDVPGARSQTSLNVMQYPGASDTSSGTSFSLLDYLSYNPYDRDQGDCGNCWEWTSTGIMEIALAYKNGTKDRLSVQYLNSNMEDKACCGNCIETAAQFYEDSKMAIPWANPNAQYNDGEGSCGSSAVPASSISTTNNYPIKSIQAQKIPTHGVGKEVAIDNIKAALHKGQAVYFSFYLPNKGEWDKFNDFWKNQPESAVWQPDSACGNTYDYEGGSAHAVLLVGYDETDPNNRYWIILNSWGTRLARPNGLFSVNMDMDYDCEYPSHYAFFFQTLDVNYDAPSRKAPVPEPEPIRVPVLNVEVANDVYTPRDPMLYYCVNNGLLSYKNRIYLTGPDLNKVASVTYILDPSFENPEVSSSDPGNSFEIWIMTWGRFPMQAIITTKSGQVFEKDYYFSFKSNVEEALARGIPQVESC
jgi:hypothetical protein